MNMTLLEAWRTLGGALVGLVFTMFALGAWYLGCELYGAIVAWRREREVLIDIQTLRRDALKRLAQLDTGMRSALANTDHQDEVNDMK